MNFTHLKDDNLDTNDQLDGFLRLKFVNFQVSFCCLYITWQYKILLFDLVRAVNHVETSEH